MKLLSLDLKNIRNMADLHLEASPQRNVIVGKNGQGKTNLLEALYFISHARSCRTNQERELVKADAAGDGARMALTVHSEKAAAEGMPPTLLEARFTPTAATALGEASESVRFRTGFKVDGSPLKSRSQLLGRFPTVSFFSSDMALLRGSPADRRRWLDTAASQVAPQHFEAVAAFEDIRQQKARFLKQAGEDRRQPVNLELLAVLNQQFLAAATRLVASRQSYVTQVTPHFHSAYGDLAGDATVDRRLAYALTGVSDKGLPVSENDYAAQLQARLLEVQAEELRRGVCRVGPHRDEVSIALQGLDATAYASQGQQRSLVLALKLAELTLLTQTLGEAPVLLLDDVMAELDPSRQAFLMQRIGEADLQVFLATTHLEQQVLQDFIHQPGSALYHVEAGRVAVLSTASAGALPV